MENTGRLYATLFQVVRHPHQWLDVRHAKTLTWMMVGLIQTGMISLTAWAPFVKGRAVYAQSTVRRFARWLDNDRIQVHHLYGPLIQQAIAEWGEHTLYLALDTSMLWGRYCVIRIAVIYRGRAVPLVWTVLEHASSSVAYETYQGLLDRAATLLPLHCRVVFLADRGFVDTDLLAQLTRLGWHWRIRLKGNLWVYRPGQGRRKVNRITLAPGHALCWHNVYLTEQRHGPVHVAPRAVHADCVARRTDGAESWFVVSDEPTTVVTFDEYGLRFDIEENFLDDKSNGFQLAASLIRSAEALTRLCFVLAMTTLYLVAQGTAVVAEGKRRWVDPHWCRGSSYLKIGWQWVKTALSQGYALLTHLRLTGEPDPEPARASKNQDRCPPQRSFSVETIRYG